MEHPDARAFIALVNKALAASASRDLLVYVHGSNNTLPRAAAQAAQLRHFTGRRMVVLVFLWPSAGSILRYFTDVANAQASVDAFVRLIELLAANTRAAGIDVLAYRAGAMIASPGLARAAGEVAAVADPGSLGLGEVYYAAPDIDLPVFVDNLPRYQGQVRRVTVSVNMGDRVLSFTEWFHRVSRAGRPNLADIGPEETQWLVHRRDGYAPGALTRDAPVGPVRHHSVDTGLALRGNPADAAADLLKGTRP